VDAVLVAANADQEDMLPPGSALATSGTDDIILDDGYRCPQDCPPPSPLNTP